MTRLDDPDVVRREYASEADLERRRAAYRYADGPNAAELAFEAVAETTPRRILDVGCGPGELTERVQRELGAEVVAVDISPRMVELAQARGIDARRGDVQELPFADAQFDCTIAAWMLYHMRDIERALDELARVLRPGGRLVAVTNDADHLKELRALVGLDGPRERTFDGTNGERLLRPRFRRVERRDAGGTIRFPNRNAVVNYVNASRTLSGEVAIPDQIEEPFVVTRHPIVFVAEKA